MALGSAGGVGADGGFRSANQVTDQRSTPGGAQDAVLFFEECLQPVQVALDKSGVGGELRIGHVGLAKESK
jgi:hypothetical protein